MTNQMLFNHDLNKKLDERKKAGPPNRMNDLNYSNWMKYQKSFFRFSNLNSLIQESIFFFTKAKWPDGKTSRSLIIGVDPNELNIKLSPRIVKVHSCDQLKDFLDILDWYNSKKQQFDFILLDLRKQINKSNEVAIFLKKYSKRIFTLMRKIMIQDRYCCLLLNQPNEKGNGFPIPWAISQSARSYMRLRDEKIALQENEGRLFNCVFLQALDDIKITHKIIPEDICISNQFHAIPLWIIPKPPPRKKNEILHPAKFPETLVGEFIEFFTKPGDKILDPMVGTGSTVVAALQHNRKAYGIDLNPEFVQISRERTENLIGTRLLPVLSNSAQGVILQGDATKMLQIDELKKVKFEYAITSPPYWSMLRNPGSEGQRDRRKKGLMQVYSDSKDDLGNVANYDKFLSLLVKVYCQIAIKLVKGAILTVIVKNIKRDHIQYTLAWDLTSILCGPKGKYEYVGTTFWCQDNIGLKPFAVGTHWVSNTLHQYCIHFKKK